MDRREFVSLLERLYMYTLRLLAYVMPTVLLVVYSQIVLKWRIPALGVLPAGEFDKFLFLLRLLFDPYVASGFIAAFLGSLAWMAVISKIPLSVGFPAYYGLTFALVILGSAWLLNEELTILKLIGAGLVLLGVIVGSLG
jgi:multidrug transporter EmrE-like cation transporter